MDIGGILKGLRLKKKLSQVAAASKLNTTQAYLSMIESNTRIPARPFMKRLCKLYGVPSVFVAFLGMEEKDVPKNKLTAFRVLKPLMDNLINEFVESK